MLTRKLQRLSRLLCILLLIAIISFFIFTISRNEVAPDWLAFDATEPHSDGQKLAIIVPFRDRFDELLLFVPLLTEFLAKQNILFFKFFIINQSSRYRFNRGALANIGFLIAKNSSDYIAIHDVDLIPLNNNLSYSYPNLGPHHIASPEYHPQYNYSKYFGGILLISNKHFESVNGMSNRYFGWGLEDDEFFTRIKAAKLPISRPQYLLTNRSNTFLHFHYNRKRDTFKTAQQREILSRRDKVTGLSTVDFNVTNKHELTIDVKYRCTVFDVEIGCNQSITPWCLPSATKRTRPTLRKEVD